MLNHVDKRSQNRKCLRESWAACEDLKRGFRIHISRNQEDNEASCERGCQLRRCLPPTLANRHSLNSCDPESQRRQMPKAPIVALVAKRHLLQASTCVPQKKTAEAGTGILHHAHPRRLQLELGPSTPQKQQKLRCRIRSSSVLCSALILATLHRKPITMQSPGSTACVESGCPHPCSRTRSRPKPDTSAQHLKAPPQDMNSGASHRTEMMKVLASIRAWIGYLGSKIDGANRTNPFPLRRR